MLNDVDICRFSTSTNKKFLVFRTFASSSKTKKNETDKTTQTKPFCREPFFTGFTIFTPRVNPIHTYHIYHNA